MQVLSVTKSVLLSNVCALVLLAGCGGDDEQASAPRPSPQATPAPGIEEATPEPTRAPEATATATPELPDEGGDEAGNRVDVDLRLAVEDVLPRRLEVPAFLGLRLRVRNESGAERVVRLDDEVVLELGPGDSESVAVEGLQPGEHTVDAGESGRAVIDARRATPGDGEDVEGETGGTAAP